MVEVMQPSDWEELNSLCLAEEHPMVGPTHVIRRQGNITGALSLGGATQLSIFLSKKGKNKLDMLSINRFVRSYCDSISNNNLLLQIGPTSPGWPIMEKMGAKYLGLGHYWYYET